MGIAGQIGAAFASIAALLGFMALVHARASASGWSGESQRKLVHIAAGLYAICLPFFFSQDWPVYLLLGLTILVMAVLRLPGPRRSGAGAALHSVERHSYGDFLLVAGVALVFLLSERDPLLHVLPLAVLTLGDAAAALAGSAYGRRFFAVDDGRKSVEGSAMLFLVTMILSMVCLLLLSRVGRENVVILSVVIAAFATLIEADSWKGFDNLFLPVGVLIVLREHGNSPAAELVWLPVAYLAALLLFLWIGRRLEVPRHVSRVYLAAIFLLVSVTALQNVVFCVAMLVLHLIAERRLPGRGSRPELDAVASLAAVSFGWLAAGQASGFNALDAFGATAAGLCMGLAMLAVADRSAGVRTAVLVLLLLAMPPVWTLLMALNPPEKRWMPHAALVMIATISICGVVVSAFPAAFRRDRMARLVVLSVSLPALAFGIFAVVFEGNTM